MGTARHLLRQGPVIAALLRVARRGAGEGQGSPPEVPGPVHRRVVPPRAPSLVRDYLRHVGGSPSAYRGSLPGHLFPQWGFPLLSELLADLPWDLRRVLNGGCSLERRGLLPADRALELRAWLEDVDANERRVVLTQRLDTCVEGEEEAALIARVVAVIPLPRDPSEPRSRQHKPRVPREAQPVDQWMLRPRHARAFAALTGDINPVHWLPPYARAAGFRRPINHGFSTMARAIEGLNKAVWAGDPTRLSQVEVRFVRPLVLPARVHLFVDGRGAEFGLYVGEAPGGPAWLTGRVHARVDQTLEMEHG